MALQEMEYVECCVCKTYNNPRYTCDNCLDKRKAQLKEQDND